MFPSAGRHSALLLMDHCTQPDLPVAAASSDGDQMEPGPYGIGHGMHSYRALDVTVMAITEMQARCWFLTKLSPLARH
eukprot:CAMPEP_0174358306 /NCGR_PEP_ID=MMETSP0811_2-20130205/41832_1 /TAXON_ID=73025 ORGANISM="Eutreptiella gymnastica-like, Strain CCMP1594" /NCGR_SAMPLE_ID=MMETSP0811_2 /ASSEMBLY_ACC=CAM_ASM_000667 /LENGTH=77 /DNA_ID=CAMNT_0015491965 /DNA_START=873 /DNA_END=1106 /DNA_ORIENTATION=+